MTVPTEVIESELDPPYAFQTGENSMTKSSPALLLPLLFFLVVLLMAHSAVSAETTLTNLTLTEVAEFDSAVIELTHANDGRRFVAEQSGIIHIIDTNDDVLPTPFLDIRSRVNFGGERGLLGLAFDPDYANNGHFYVNYIDQSSAIGDTRIARYTVSNGNPDVADSAETTILTLDQPAGNHNSGPIRFGPDGYLYITVGDGGSAGDPWNYSQDGSSLFGKLLRINVTGVTTYTIPASNPYTQTATIRDEIWSMGLRNPWRFDFDSVTGDLWLADVGQAKFEEVNFTPAGVGGLNYGWDCYEANHLYDSLNNDPDAPSPLCDTRATYTPPIHSYSRDVGSSITGGTVYRGSQNPAMYGHYFFADARQNKFWAISGSPGAFNVDALTTNSDCGDWYCPVSFGTDSAGELYVGYANGTLYQLSTTDAPTAVSTLNQQIQKPDAAIVVATSLILLFCSLGIIVKRISATA